MCRANTFGQLELEPFKRVSAIDVAQWRRLPQKALPGLVDCMTPGAMPLQDRPPFKLRCCRVLGECTLARGGKNAQAKQAPAYSGLHSQRAPPAIANRHDISAAQQARPDPAMISVNSWAADSSCGRSGVSRAASPHFRDVGHQRAAHHMPAPTRREPRHLEARNRERPKTRICG
jgi:hypothetical protein